jgi:uncharacterized protein (TIGR02246 family)
MGDKVGQNDNGSADEAAIRQLIENWAAAVRHRDMAGILRHHAPDFLIFDVPPPFQSKGLAAYKESWGLFFSWSAEPVVFDIKTMDVVAGSDVAFVAAAMQCAGANESSPLDFRLTVGLRKIDGQWTICHEHHSVPAEN